jgi:multiple sugar transport system substrate-binding protein/lactose/L-arabinose transport system substrate-binding protein
MMNRGVNQSRRMFLKTVSLASAGAAFAALTANCASSTQAPAGGEQAPATEAKEMLFWAWDEPISDLLKKGFETKYPDITVNHEIVANYSETLYTSLVAGAGLPDCAWEDAHSYQKLARTGQLTALDDLLASYKPDILSFLWEAGLYDGTQYGAPRRYAPEVLWYRKDRFEEAGIDPAAIETWDDFVGLGQNATDESHHMTVYTTVGSLDYNLQALIFSNNGTGFFDADDNIVVNSPENVACAEKWLSVVQSGIAREMELWQPAWYDAARTGEIASLIMPYWYGSEPRVQMPDEAGKWDILRVPSLVQGVQNASIWQGAMFWVIPQKATNAELGWQFVEYTTFDYEDEFMQESMDREFVLPAYTKFMESDYFWSEAEAYFGSNLRQRAHELAQGAPVNYLPPEYAECEGILINEMLKVVLGEQAPQQALDNAATQFDELLKARV